MRDYINIGPTPAEEECAQTGFHDSSTGRRECVAFIAAIRRVLGPEPEGAELRVKRFEHDFGTYHEVVCYYEECGEGSVFQPAQDYAFKCEAEAPQTWAEARMNAPYTYERVGREMVQTPTISFVSTEWVEQLFWPDAAGGRPVIVQSSVA